MIAKRKGARTLDQIAQELPDIPVSDSRIRETFGWSASTQRRKRELEGFPVCDFYVSRQGFTWWSRVVEWTKQQPKTSPIAGRMVGRDGPESEAA